MTRSFKSRVDDATFDLNLAPMLDIIVSIVPMLLLSVVFVNVTMIETPLPQPVADAIEKQKDEKIVTVNLALSKQYGYKFLINENGKKSEVPVPMKGSEFDFNALHAKAAEVKRMYPQVFRMEVLPEQDLKLDEIIRSMDEVRRFKRDEGKVAFTDTKTGQTHQTDLMFPEVVFGNVLEQ